MKGVIFDFGKVICNINAEGFFNGIASHSNLSYDEIVRRVNESGLPSMYDSGKISSLEFYHLMSELCNSHISCPDFVKFYIDIFEEIPSTIRLISTLKKNDYRLGLLSNASKWHFERYIKNVEIFPLFDAVTTSSEVGVMKPDEAIFLNVQEKMGMPFDELVYIDDVDLYVKKATSLGMIGIQKKDGDNLSAKLRQHGIIC